MPECFRRSLSLLVLLLLPALAVASDDAYTVDSFTGDLGRVRWDAAATFGGISVIGFTRWNWGKSAFHEHAEGWFGADTRYGGTDKLGHAFTAYLLTNGFAERMVNEGAEPGSAALSGMLVAQALTLYVEIFDGFSKDHGFSWEDGVMNGLGGGLGWLRQRYPAVREVVDYRMEYEPSGFKGFEPLGDYAGQKYLLAFKLAALEPCLCYLELQAGYYARGFTTAEQLEGRNKERQHFIGLGLDFSRLFLGERQQRESLGKRTGRFFFEHIQLPQTSLRSGRRR